MHVLQYIMNMFWYKAANRIVNKSILLLNQRHSPHMITQPGTVAPAPQPRRMSGKALLVLGATGKTGSRVLEVALERGWVTTAFVRNPAKLAEPVRSRLAAVVQGDLNDADAVEAAVRSARPDAIVDASSALPLPTKGGAPKNSADRNIFYGAVARALAADGRTDRCVLICEGGQLVPEPGGKIHSWSVSCVAALVRLALGARKWGASRPRSQPAAKRSCDAAPTPTAVRVLCRPRPRRQTTTLGSSTACLATRSRASTL